MSIEDRLAITDLIHRYAHTYDQGNPAGLAELFADDATFEIRGTIGDMPSVIEGRDAIVDHMTRRFEATRPAQRRHIMANVLIERLDGDRAEAAAYLLLGSTVDGDLALPVTGRYEDELVRQDGRWRFQRRVLSLDGGLS